MSLAENKFADVECPWTQNCCLEVNSCSSQNLKYLSVPLPDYPSHHAFLQNCEHSCKKSFSPICLWRHLNFNVPSPSHDIFTKWGSLLPIYYQVRWFRFPGAEVTVVGDQPPPRADLAWYVGEEWVRTGVIIEFSRACKSLLLYWVQTSNQQLCVECGLLETDWCR